MPLYDKLDWHESSAVEAGFPPENGFTHIGFFIAWLINRDLHESSLFPAEYVALVKRGEMRGSDLSDLVDTKLVSNVMTPDASAFADARYGTYTSEYERLFAGQADYGVTDDAVSYAKVERLLDDLYAAWIADGRPAADQGDSEVVPGAIPTSFTIITPPGYSDEDWAEVVRRAEAGEPFEPRPQDERYMPHADPGLEALIPRDATTPPIALSSTLATHWGSSLLNRTLKRLGVKPKDVTVVSGIGGERDETVAVTLYAVPGIPHDKLNAEFAFGIDRPPGGRWEQRDVAGIPVNWASAHGFLNAYWTRDGLVFHVGGGAATTRRVVERILSGHSLA